MMPYARMGPVHQHMAGYLKARSPHELISKYARAHIRGNVPGCPACNPGKGDSASILFLMMKVHKSSFLYLVREVHRSSLQILMRKVHMSSFLYLKRKVHRSSM